MSGYILDGCAYLSRARRCIIFKMILTASLELDDHFVIMKPEFFDCKKFFDLMIDNDDIRKSIYAFEQVIHVHGSFMDFVC